MIFGCWVLATMVQNKRLRNGIGVLVTVYKKFLHTRKGVCQVPLCQQVDVLHHLLVLVCTGEEKTVNKSQQVCVIMRHVKFDDGLLLYAVAPLL